jgi:two-component system sensor histidine kinase BaeS
MSHNAPFSYAPRLTQKFGREATTILTQGDLERHYSQQNDWRFLNENHSSLTKLIEDRLLEPSTITSHEYLSFESQTIANREQRLFDIKQRLMILDSSRTIVYGTSPTAKIPVFHPLMLEGETIGYLGIEPGTSLVGSHHQEFVSIQKTTFIKILAAILLLAAVVLAFLSRRMTTPLRKLANATRALVLGKHVARIDINTDDELGTLSRDFNVLAQRLERNEQARRQFIADISHELRTPLSILRGEIEALQDGVRPLTQQAVASLHSEVKRLNRLVDDLYQLALTDIGALNYHKTEFDLTELLEERIEQIRPELVLSFLSLNIQLPDEHIYMLGDSGRLAQLCDNLMQNAVKYTDAGGEVAVSLKHIQHNVIIEIMDSVPGVSAGDESRLFERLYRVNRAHGKVSGGAGLGLSICRNIVEAHDGTIEAHPSPLGGLLIRVTLPVGEQPS